MSQFQDKRPPADPLGHHAGADHDPCRVCRSKPAVRLTSRPRRCNRRPRASRRRCARDWPGGRARSGCCPRTSPGRPARERGEAVAIDFGGTNVRILKVCLDDGQVQCGKSSRFNLKDPNGAYDFTREQTRAEDLFDFIAQHVMEVLAGDVPRCRSGTPSPSPAGRRASTGRC